MNVCVLIFYRLRIGLDNHNLYIVFCLLVYNVIIIFFAHYISLTEKEHITAFRTLGYFLRTKKRADSQCTNDMVDVQFLMCQAPVRNYNIVFLYTEPQDLLT